MPVFLNIFGDFKVDCILKFSSLSSENDPLNVLQLYLSGSVLCFSPTSSLSPRDFGIVPPAISILIILVGGHSFPAPKQSVLHILDSPLHSPADIFIIVYDYVGASSI